MSGSQELRGNLDRLAGDGRWFLQRWRLRETLRAAGSHALWALFVLPLLVWLVQLTRGLSGGMPERVNPWLILGLAILGPVLYLLGRLAVTYYRYHPRRQNALALYDAELKIHDRLVTADEFLGEGEAAGGDSGSYGFKQAAVADADQHARAALRAALSPLSLSQWKIQPLSWLGVPAAILVALLLLLQIDGAELSAKATEKALLAAAEASAAPDGSEEKRAAARKLARKLRQQLQEQQLALLDKQDAAPTKNRKSRHEKGTEGESNTGNSATAQSSSTSSNAAGDPSGQKNASKPKKPEEQKPDEEDTKDPKKKPKKPKKQQVTQLAMSATSGEGKMSMSNSNPTEFDMPEEEDRADAGGKQSDIDQDAEDEDEEEKSKGSTKPSLNDMKAASERDLKPALQKRLDIDGTDRGGPDARKRTRGVPSLILGIPVPDRVQGMPNPGRSKVTQEDAKPKEESHPALEAQYRMASADDMGEVAHPGLLQWMQTVIENYFTTLREQGDAGAPDEGN